MKMIEVRIHGIEVKAVELLPFGGYKTFDYTGDIVVSATVHCWINEKLVWTIEGQDFTFYKPEPGTFKEYEDLIRGLFKND